MLASDVIGKAQIILNDLGAIRWTEPELRGWVYSGELEAINLKPNCAEVIRTLTLAPGAKQSVPTDCVLMLNVSRNIGTGGVGGKAVKDIPRAMLDNCNPDWMTGPPSITVNNFMYDTDSPMVFWVYPPQTSAGGGQVEARLVVKPTRHTNSSDALTIADIYENALVDYVVYRGMSKDSDNTANQAFASLHYQRFVDGIMIRGTKEATGNSPAPPQQKAA